MQKLRKTFIAILILFFANNLLLLAQRLVSYSPKLSVSTISKLAQNAKNDYLQVYLTLADTVDVKDFVAHYGIKLNVCVDNTYTALVPKYLIEELSKDASVLSIDVGGEPTSMTDLTRGLTHADLVVQGDKLPQGFDGSGVIIGVVDTGFDFLHPAFLNNQLHSRIVCVWDQVASNGNLSDYGYGSVYEGRSEVENVKHDLSTDTHGTHVLGIASGSIWGKYGGIAPNAELAVVSTNKSEQGIIDGVDFLLKYAEKVRKPIAINVSLGTVLGYKDGTSNFSRMLDGLLKDKQGALLCIAAGNEGHRNSMLSANTERKTCLKVPSYGRENVFVQCEIGYNYSLEVVLKNKTTGEVIMSKLLSSDKQETVSIEEIAGQKASSFSAASKLNEITGAPSFAFSINYTHNTEEQWIVSVRTNGGHYTMGCDYGAFSADGNEDYCDGTSVGSVASTATGLLPIAVGAYVSRNHYIDISGIEQKMDWNIGSVYPMSGRGPSFDGRIKPDISAPGAAVISSLNSYAANYAVSQSMKVAKEVMGGRTYFWGVNSGTSMATPVVTGIMALWLQAFPNLTVDEVRKALFSTAIVDTNTGNVPNGDYGYGKVDAFAGLNFLLSEISGIEGIKKPIFSYNPYTRLLTISKPVRVKIFSIDGIKVMDTFSKSIALNKLEPGIYVVMISGSSFKIVV